uniref:TIR domain-containing protein n=1 Tax=Candidatus Kentrum sp. TUN TaxID=2126343 RepID=A0A451AA93_9GAMM|nr:MAG: TIR domain-containing protein [Candidatus Kentron sp. TUN]VFK71935.1 MAG: TIR domain-containing protein [Candidatus Kentron sp. TUN]
MSLSIFINYRREDSATESTLLYKDLVRSIGENFVFMDSRNIEIGTKWPDEIRESLATAEVVIVVIGQKWLKISDEYGRRRIDQKDDWVRQEIEFSIKNNKTIIPCIIAPAQCPPKEALPDNSPIIKLPEFQEIEIRKNYWDNDIQLLIARLTGKNQVGSTEADSPAS